LKTNQKLTAAILAALGAHAGGAYAASDTEATASTSLEEVIVTAQRRNESIQDVPITIQAITGDTLKQLNVSTFNDLLRYTPNVTFSGNGPGTGNIFMRGLSSGGAGNQSQTTTASFPNVALYLDDQSMQFPNRNVDVYMVDMERVEVLEGPQGTLFGGGAQAGAIRYITNKPKLDVTEGNANAGYGVTTGGDPNSNLNATINLPLITDQLAIRATIFNDRRGGYIDNVPGSISFVNIPTAAALKAFPVANPPTASPVAFNAGDTGSNTNTVTYTGARLSALLKINDDWNVLLQQNWQNFEADGYFFDEPVAPNGTVLKPFQVEAFSPNYNKDKYASTAWTINGQFGDLGQYGALRAVYTGSYLVRHIEGQEDYSNYLRSKHGSYYSCSGRGAGYSYFRSAKPTTCYAPVGSWKDVVRNTHLSHEFRISTSEDNRIRGLAGAFWEKFVIQDNMNFNYMPIAQCYPANLAISAAGGPDCVGAVGPVAGFFASDPSVRLDTNTAFGEDDERGYRQLAFFGSVDIDIIPKVLTLTGGTRHYKYDEFEHGSEYVSATSSNLNVPNGTNPGSFGINLKKSESGFKSRANLTWHITPDIMAYYTWSQGFRPGGFNRTKTNLDGSVITLKAVAPFSAGGKDKQFYKPVGYDSDNLVNNEVGFKSEWLNHRLQVNMSLYQMDWKNVQLSLFDPSHLGNTTFGINGPTYRIRGVELQLVARVMEGLTVQGSSSWNSSNQTDAPCLQSNIPAAKGNPTPLGQCITQINGNPYTNPYGVLDTSPPYSPPLQFNVRARYDFSYGEFKPFASFGTSYVGAMRNEPASFPDGNLALATLPNGSSNGGCLVGGVPNTTYCKYTMPSYMTYDAAIGVSKDNWTAQITGNNLSNSDASTHTTSGQFIKSEIPLRPRVVTFEIGFKF
jgi:outer membrane receptor protein involved in Fe transport